jgi:L-cysteine desulfidase
MLWGLAVYLAFGVMALSYMAIQCYRKNIPFMMERGTKHNMATKVSAYVIALLLALLLWPFVLPRHPLKG